jgi:hypothetical protein
MSRMDLTPAETTVTGVLPTGGGGPPPPPPQLRQVGADVHGVLAAPVHPAHAASHEYLDTGLVSHLQIRTNRIVWCVEQLTSMVPETVVPPCSRLATTQGKSLRLVFTGEGAAASSSSWLLHKYYLRF